MYLQRQKSYLSDISLSAEKRFKYFLLLPEALSREEVSGTIL